MTPPPSTIGYNLKQKGYKRRNPFDPAAGTACFLHERGKYKTVSILSRIFTLDNLIRTDRSLMLAGPLAIRPIVAIEHALWPSSHSFFESFFKRLATSRFLDQDSQGLLEELDDDGRRDRCVHQDLCDIADFP
jgi:hypothetical protein